MLNRWRVVAVSGSIAALLAVLLAPATACATNLSDFTVTPATGGEALVALSAADGWTSLNGPTINVTPYSNPDVFPAGLTFTVTLPPNVKWNATVTTPPSVAVAADAPAGFCQLVPSSLTYMGIGASRRLFTFTLGGTHDVGCVLKFSGLQIRAVGQDLSAGTGGDITVEWSAPSLGASRAFGGIVRMSPPGGPTAPPTDAVAAEGRSGTPAGWPVLPAVLGLLALIIAARIDTRPSLVE